MSIIIPCPHCGPRAIEEYAYGEVYAVPETIADPDEHNLDRAFMHNNAEGPVTEAWFHTYGCRRWVYVERDTSTDTLL